MYEAASSTAGPSPSLLSKTRWARGVTKAVTHYMALSTTSSIECDSPSSWPFVKFFFRGYSRMVGLLSSNLYDEQPQLNLMYEIYLRNLTLPKFLIVTVLVFISSLVSVSVREGLRANFEGLVSACYVERCPRPEPFIEPPPQDETRSTRKCSSKSCEETPSVEQQAMIAAALSDAERFFEIADTATELTDIKSTDHYPDVSVGDKVYFGYPVASFCAYASGRHFSRSVWSLCCKLALCRAKLGAWC
ncbi:uncharacterized protein LOC113463275 [Phoenix dactylifera]|uniref:Uncharacterized protein LOC113463275 n=1 Tax=Phoenix dactylifera TaxID=42345 RepID=A0A8B8J907_PHODC|nr:uncharacterized protein LOC113463275 [Phoenix dactylifera]